MEYRGVFLIREDRKIERCKIGLLGLFLRMSKSPQAWYYLASFLQQVQGFGRQYWQFIYERWAMPTSPYQSTYFTDDKKIEELADQNKVAEQAANFTAADVEIQTKKTRYWDLMGIATIGVVILFIIVVLMVASGKVNFGQLLSGFTGGG